LIILSLSFLFFNKVSLLMTESRYMAVAMHQVTTAYERTLVTLNDVLAHLDEDRFDEAFEAIKKNTENAMTLMAGLDSCHPEKVREMADSKISNDGFEAFNKSLQVFVVLEKGLREKGSEPHVYEVVCWVRDSLALLLALARRL
jgi:hypothetical protein